MRDYMAVLDEIDQVIAEVDRRPAQVAIEAMILRVTLHDEYKFGVDFELLRQNPDVRLATGSPLPNVGNLDFNEGGLKFAFLNGSTNAFIDALETIGDTNVIASPRLMCIDKARAEILIGQQLGYVNQTITETATAQNVQFLEVGGELRLRPFISSDGLIRMEVHPELSTGQVKVVEGFTLPDKDLTQVTTNIMVPDGATMIIGGLMRRTFRPTPAKCRCLARCRESAFCSGTKRKRPKKKKLSSSLRRTLCAMPKRLAKAINRRRNSIGGKQFTPIR